MAKNPVIDGIRLALAKSLQEAVEHIQANQAKEAEGHLKLQKNDGEVHDPVAVDAAINRYKSAQASYANTKPIRAASRTSLATNSGVAPAKGYSASTGKRIPSLQKPSLGKKEELDPGKDPKDNEDCLNKEEKQSKARVQSKDPAAVALGRRGGLKGGPAREAHTSHAQRVAIAEKGANARWGGGGTNNEIKDQQFDPNKDTKKSEFQDPEPSEKEVNNTGTVIDKPAEGAKLPPKRIPQMPPFGSGGEVDKGKLDKGAIADAVAKAKTKAKAMGISDDRLKDAGFPGNVKKSTIPSAPTAPKPKMPQTTPASSTPAVSAPSTTPKAL
jgi:hypothetical protein